MKAYLTQSEIEDKPLVRLLSLYRNTGAIGIKIPKGVAAEKMGIGVRQLSRELERLASQNYLSYDGKHIKIKPTIFIKTREHDYEIVFKVNMIGIEC